MAATPVPNTLINFQDLGNLLAPANGVTHAAIFNATMNNSTVTMSMASLWSFIGFNFRAQAMTVDNQGGGSAVTVKGQFSQFTEVVPAGVKRTFQYPSVADEILLFSSPGSVTAQIFLYDYPAFPDSNVASPGPLSVSILGQPISVVEVQPTLAYAAADATSITAGSTITVFAGSTIINQGVIKNPTASGTQILIDAVGAPAATEGGTTYGLDPGASITFGPTSVAVQARNPSGGTVNLVAYKL